MPTTIKDRLGLEFHEGEIVGSPELFGSETVVAYEDDDWFFFWTLNAGDVGKTVYALPDVALVGDGTTSGSFLADEVVWGEIAIYQHYTQTNLNTGETTSGFLRITSGSQERDQVLAQQYINYQPYPGVEGNASYFLKIVVPALRQDTTGYGYNTDYDDNLILVVSANNGALDDNPYLPGDPHAGRFLVTTNSPGGERALAWGGGWIDLLGSAQQHPDPPAENEGALTSLTDTLKTIVKGAKLANKFDQTSALANSFLSQAMADELGYVRANNPFFQHLFDPDVSWKDWIAESKGSPNKVGTALKWGGRFLTTVSALADGVQKYQETGSASQGFKYGGTKLFVGLLSGEVGSIVGAGATAWAVSAGGATLAATGLPIIAGFAVGVGAAAGVTYLADWALGDPENIAPRRTMSMAAEAAASSKPKWEYNVKTKQFKWLDDAAAKKYAHYATLLDLDPRPMKLKLVGDRFDDKNDLLLGHGANDTLKGLSGDDILNGGKARDKVLGGSGNDVLYGDKGNDTLNGGSGNDTLFGGGGDDKILGGVGRDILVGQGGRDIFIFSAPSESGFGDAADFIAHFQQGKDKIDLSRIDGDPVTAGNQPLTLSQLSKSTEATGRLPVSTLYVDIDKDGTADMSIKVEGVTSIFLSDLIL